MQLDMEYDHVAEERLENNILQGYCMFLPAVHLPCLVGIVSISGLVVYYQCCFSKLLQLLIPLLSFVWELGATGEKELLADIARIMWET